MEVLCSALHDALNCILTFYDLKNKSYLEEDEEKP